MHGDINARPCRQLRVRVFYRRVSISRFKNRTGRPTLQGDAVIARGRTKIYVTHQASSKEISRFWAVVNYTGGPEAG